MQNLLLSPSCSPIWTSVMIYHLRPFIFLLVSLALRCNALIYENVSDLPSLYNYDYVIVGGGTAGGVIANRLSEDHHINVLVLEAGPTNRGRPEVTIPYLIRVALSEPSLDWNTTYIPQPGLNGRVIAFTRGYILGGSSSINGMVYSRGTAEDYDRYAAVTGDPGWSWDALQPYFRKARTISTRCTAIFTNLPFQNERFRPSAVDGFNTTGRYNPAVHGTKGITGTSMNAYPMDTDSIITRVTEEASDEFPFVLDYNSGVAHGIGWAQYTIQHGTRASSAWSYLADEYVERKNMHVLVGATVRRVFQSSAGGAVDTVEFFHGADNGTTLYTNASREIILSAGTAGSPYILLKSGVGDARTLATMNISAIADLPGVGQNLSEQTLVPNTRWVTTSTDNFQHILDNATTEAEAYAEWNKSRSGPFAAGGINQLIWLRMNESDPEVQQMLEKYGDPAAGPFSPHFEITPSNGRPMSGPLMDVSPIALNPYSRGSLTLDPTNPLGPPILDGGFYNHPMDMFVQKQAILTAIRMVSLPAWSDYVVEPSPGFAAVFTADGSVDDQALETFIRNNTLSNIHAVGTDSMSPYGAKWGVVDPDLKVKGLKGLRVVDASILPFVAAGHTMAPVYVLAERAADLIKQANV
ncbi:hypothetical protein EW146_g4634 [Bondarzewia mesenterica]|uniref:Glucose-methanol-choline oxidoreductase N-terminal domain-containing protein n=1 Tax=Bondarzewia mesenterica TaxID=1095465 RepID=A0A4S4LTZ5_9AGAM|nr:hypothetical protein EW146_g4634 [Bondarzewia mesenterica]